MEMIEFFRTTNWTTFWTTFLIAFGGYAVITFSSFLIADKTGKRFLVYLIYTLIALSGFIAFLLMRLFWNLNIFWNDLFKDLAIFFFIAFIIEIIYMVRAKKQEQEIRNWYKKNFGDPEFEKLLKDIEQEMNDPNRPHAHD